MNRIRLFFTISIFLSAAFSVRGQDAEQWLAKAVGYERVVYDGGSPVQVNDALLSKAECYCRAGEWRLAAGTLERVRMYALPEDRRDSVIFSKGVCYFACGEYGDAASCLSELTEFEDLASPERKSAAKGMFLALLPPLGHIYAGAPGEGALSFVMNASVLAAAVWQVCCGFYVTGLLGGAFAFERTYFGAQERVACLIEEYNKEAAGTEIISIFAEQQP